MKIVMKETRCISPDGWRVFEAQKGKIYTVPDNCALPLIRAGIAERSIADTSDMMPLERVLSDMAETGMIKEIGDGIYESV